jgi:pilus assembly protein Flp/PilA
MKQALAHFIRDEDGATAIEYGLIAAGISIAIILGVSLAGPQLSATFCSIAGALGSTAACS